MRRVRSLSLFKIDIFRNRILFEVILVVIENSVESSIDKRVICSIIYIRTENSVKNSIW
jgi:hypothetical protein